MSEDGMSEDGMSKLPPLGACSCGGKALHCEDFRGGLRASGVMVWVECSACPLATGRFSSAIPDCRARAAAAWERLRAAPRSALRQPVPEWVREFARTMAPALGMTSHEILKDIEASSGRIDTLSRQARALIDDIKAAAPEEVWLMVARLLRLDRALTGERLHAALGRVSHDANFAPLLADVRKLHTQVETRVDGYRETLERTLRELAEDLKQEGGL